VTEDYTLGGFVMAGRGMVARFYKVWLCGWLPRELAMEQLKHELLHQEIRSAARRIRC